VKKAKNRIQRLFLERGAAAPRTRGKRRGKKLTSAGGRRTRRLTFHLVRIDKKKKTTWEGGGRERYGTRGHQ